MIDTKPFEKFSHYTKAKVEILDFDSYHLKNKTCLVEYMRKNLNYKFGFDNTKGLSFDDIYELVVYTMKKEVDKNVCDEKLKKIYNIITKWKMNTNPNENNRTTKTQKMINDLKEENSILKSHINNLEDRVQNIENYCVQLSNMYQNPNYMISAALPMAYHKCANMVQTQEINSYNSNRRVNYGYSKDEYNNNNNNNQ